MTSSDALRRAARLAAFVSATGAFLATNVALAQPVQMVTVCGRDDAGGGLNLATALALGGNISIQCPSGQDTIELTRTHALTAAVAIAGDGRVKLHGPSSAPMFTTSQRLQLKGLTLVNPAAVAGSIVSGDKAHVVLESVRVEDSSSAFLVHSLQAAKSRFSHNGDPAAAASGSAVINAETIELSGSEFVGNTDHPIAGGAFPTPARIALSRRVTIDDTVFTGNRATLLLIDARVSIRASRFVENGLPIASARESWGCCGGAITLVRSDAEVFDSEFRANGSSGFGGAIHAVGSRLTVARSTFRQNTARVGGAIMSWARPPRVNIWSTDDWIDLPRLVLTRVTFDGNTATELGGAVAFAGSVASEGLVFRHNEAGSAGGAIASWRAAILPERDGSVFQVLVDNTQVQPEDRISLARSILVENRAGASGAALSVADAEAALGDVIIARNTAGAGAAVTGVRLRIVNTVIADNDATGLAAPLGATVGLGNTAVFGNRKGNCALAAPPLILGPNLQNPGGDCGGQIRIANPGLDGSYAPGIVSAARGAGDYGLCVTDPNVMGVDIYGSTRIRLDRTCAVGAIERDLSETVASALTFGSTHGLGQRLQWLLLLLLLLTFIVAVVTGRRRRSSILSRRWFRVWR